VSASIHSLSRKPIVAGIAVVFALSSCTVCATTLVTNCKDDGSAGTLRSAVAAAPSGDTVDASALTSASPGCAASKITLTMGEIVVNKSSLTIKGPGKDKLTVTALYDNGVSSHQYENRIFSHTGTGGLGIQNLTVSNGLQTGTFNPSRGGCIYSKGQVTLDGAIISSCAARTTNSSAQGGGIFAQQVQLTNSTVSGNYADAGANGDAAGGGIYDNGTVILTTSSVISNYAGHAGRAVGDGGGIVSHGNGALVLYSTIGNNTAGNQFGGWQMIANATSHLSMYNSTISGNHAHGLGGGLYAVVNTVEMTNSTIAFNTAHADDPAIAPGLSLAGTGSTPTAYLVSVLMSANVFGSSDTSHDATVVGMSENGSGNLIHIGQTFGLNQSGCPLLGPLRDNGGPTMTNALLSGNPATARNPAIDRGLVRDYNDDQRGYTRLADIAPDIGAYEVQQDDIIFNDSFGDGCP
jgi:hypothetical protein